MTDTTPSSNLVTFYGKMLTFSRIKITTDDFDIIKSHLATVSPTKNSLIPVVIDSDVNLDLKKLVDLLWSWGLQPIGVVKGLLNEQAKTMKIALFPADGKRIKKIPQKEKIISAPVVEHVEKIEVPEKNTKKETDTINNIKQTESVNQLIVKDDIDTDKLKKPSQNKGLKTSLTSQKTLSEEQDTNTASENESKSVIEEAESTGGLFGKTDRAKIFGEKVIASNNILSSSDSFEQKNSSNTKNESTKNNKVSEDPVLEVSEVTKDKNNIAEDILSDETTVLKQEHEAEKQAEEKIKRFSSRAEVIAKINEANKSKDDTPENHDTCEANNEEIDQSSKNSQTGKEETILSKSTKSKDKSNNQVLQKEIYLSTNNHVKSNDTDPANKAKNSNNQKTDKQSKKPKLKEQTKVRVEYVTVYENEKITSRVYDQVLRSGQSINHVGGDLILTNSVNDGAEAITDNSLHIYGRGMGRLVAGATGDQAAQIFCQKFNPSLVSVAGTYMLRDNLPTEVIDKAVQVSYKDGEGLLFRVMDN